MNPKIYANPKLPTFWHGGDYNPDQWPPETLEADLDLMDEAHCQVFSVGIFAWSALEPEEGRYEFGWLNRVMDRLAERGKYVCLATPSAAMPAWMAQKHPDILRVGPDGVRRRFGERVNHCWSSPEYLRRCREMAHRLGERYGSHPALVLWHASNEYAGSCHCERCAEAFREWLTSKFEGRLDRLNQAYWSSFWGHTFSEWDQIPIPGGPHGDESIIGLSLDWRRFVSHQIVEFCRNETEPLRELSDVPVTTNLMGTYTGIDYWKLAPHVDVIAWDSYPGFTHKPMEVRDWVYTAFRHDLARSYKRKPFLMIECTPSSSNWYPAMSLKRPGAHRMEAMQAIAHGSDAVMYFQWRASRGCSEKFHGAVVGHDGSSSTRVFNDVAALGTELEELSDIAGTHTIAEAALIYDWENAWAIELAGGPKRGKMGYLDACLTYYHALLKLSVPVDVIDSEQSLEGYKVVVAPMLYMVKPGVADRLREFVSGGGTLVLTCYSGYVDENDLCFLGGFPGPLRELVGVRVEEIDALHDGVTNSIDCSLLGAFQVTDFCELVHSEGAEVLGTYTSDFYAGRAALTRNSFGKGRTYHVAAKAEQAFADALLRSIVEEYGLRRDVSAELPEGVLARRRVGDREHLFLINYTDREVSIQLPGRDDAFRLGPYGAVVTGGQAAAGR